jgi:hypothetical protein
MPHHGGGSYCPPSINLIRKVCGSHLVELSIVKHTFQWLGNVARMPGSRFAKLVFDYVPVVGKMNVGRPKASFKHTLHRNGEAP